MEQGEHPLAAWRDSHGLSVGDAAREAGVHHTAWQQIEEGGSCHLSTARKIIEAALRLGGPVIRFEDLERRDGNA